MEDWFNVAVRHLFLCETKVTRTTVKQACGRLTIRLPAPPPRPEPAQMRVRASLEPWVLQSVVRSLLVSWIIKQGRPTDDMPCDLGGLREVSITNVVD